MNREDILLKIREVITDQISIDAEDIAEDTSLEDDLEMDSLDLLQVVTALYAHASPLDGITVEDEAFGEVKTIGDAISYIEQAL